MKKLVLKKWNFVIIFNFGLPESAHKGHQWGSGWYVIVIYLKVKL